MIYTKFLPCDKILILDKSYGCSYNEAKSSIKFWQGHYGIGWVIQVYTHFYTVGYTKADINGDFYTENDLKMFTEYELEEELFEL